MNKYLKKIGRISETTQILIWKILFQDIKDIKKLEKDSESITIKDELARGEFGVVNKGKLLNSQ